MNEYQHEQLQALELVTEYLSGLKAAGIGKLKQKLADYLCFRREVDTFLSQHFSEICSETCYQTRVSACCTREGVIIYFADVVINVIMSDEMAIQALFSILRSPQDGSKCIYLQEKGCLWRVKPLICEMFLCNKAEDAVLKINQNLQNEWLLFKKREKSFRWPVRTVLFEELEQVFLDAGHTSPLMYLHNSPGLLRVKAVSSREKGVGSRQKGVGREE